MSHIDALLKFQYWIREHKSTGEVYLWGNGILFDNNMIKTQMELLGITYPIRYSNDRDMRTILELASHKTHINQYELKGSLHQKREKHDAMNDVKSQIEVVCGCYKILIGEC